MAALPQAIWDLPQPVIAAVNGPCVGAGFALCLASDIRICSTAATFGNGAILLGLSGAEMGMSYHLPRIVGTSVAADWMLTGRTVSASEADRRGLVSELIEPDRLIDRALELASGIAELLPLGVQLTKRALQVNTDAAGPRCGHGTREPQPGAQPRHRRGRGTAGQALIQHRRKDDDGVGFLDRRRVVGATRVGGRLRALGMRADRSDRQGVARSQRSSATGTHSTAAEDRQGARFVGHPSRPALGWSRLRAGETGTAERDSRPVGMRADCVRLAGPRLRQQRDPRALRHARAEEAVPGAAAGQPHRVLLLDDRTTGRRRPEGVHHHRDPGR